MTLDIHMTKMKRFGTKEIQLVINKFKQTPEQQAIDFRRASARDAQRQDPTRFVPDNERHTLKSLQGMAPDLREQEKAYFATDYFDNQNKKPVDNKSILAANPTAPAGASPAGASPAGTKPAGAPPPAAPDGTGKIPPDRLKTIVDQNPQLQNAMDTGRPPPDGFPDLMKLAQANAKALGVSLVDPDANKTTEQLFKEEQKRKQELLGTNPSFERRKQMIDEKANLADEVKRTQAMRMAEFFAMWGSTPGNTIVAGLNALKNKVPDFIADKKEASKMRREIDRSIADLDQVDYLEKAGDLKGADARKLAAVTKAQTWAQELSKSTVTVELAKIREAGDTKRNEDRIAGGIKEANIRAAATMGAKESPENKEYHKTNDDLVKIERAIEAKVKSNGSLEGDINLIKRYSTRTELTAQQKTRLEDAKANVNKELGPLEKQRNTLTKKLEGFATKNMPADSTSVVDPSKRAPINSFYSK
jgi:hypothetical protein